MEENNTEHFSEQDLKAEENFIDQITFNKEGRYRCEQSNLSKADGNATGSGKQKFQYLMRLSSDKKFAKVKLEEHHYDFFPAVVNKSFEMISANEKIKNNDVVFSVGENGELDKIQNKRHLQKDWIAFRDTDFEDIEFVQHLKSNNPEIYQELINSGDKQFSPEQNTEIEYKANLFYLVMFDDHLTNEISSEFPVKNIKFVSILFPDTVVPMEISTEIIADEIEMVSISRKGKALVDDELLSKIKESYTKLYQSGIKYEFSEYNINFTINLKYSKYTKLMEIAECLIEEEVVNNLENLCSFNIKKVKI